MDEFGIAQPRGDGRRIQRIRPVQRNRRDFGFRVLFVQDDFFRWRTNIVFFHRANLCLLMIFLTWELRS